jgi:enamine deaminase RidA (YjgF/YER057c/UK114 family)
MEKTLKRDAFYSGIPLEKTLGSARVIKLGNYIRIAGTAAVEISGDVHAPGDEYEQTKFIFDRFIKLLKEAGAEPKDIYGIRAFATMGKEDGFGKAFKEYFSEYHPISTKYYIAGFDKPGLTIEIECEAYIGSFGE